MSDLSNSYLEETETEDAKYEIATHPLRNSEKGQFSIFISHSSKDKEEIKQIDDLLKPQLVHKGILAENIIKCGENFQKRITESLHCYAAILVLTNKSLESNWVAYECGYLDGLGIPIIVWDKDDILSFNNMNRNHLNVHILKHLPSAKTPEEVCKRIDEISIYTNMFKNETADLKKDTFNEIIKNKVETVIVNISSDLLQGKKDLFKSCELSTLVVNFGMFYDNQNKNNLCCCNNSSLTNGMCIFKNNPNRCALISSPDKKDEKSPDCVILNHVIKNGKYFDVNDDYHDNSKTTTATLSFYVPVHRYYGTEFKFIIDTPNAHTHKEVSNLCERLGFHPTGSDTLNSNRIYLSLKSAEAESVGLFQLQDGQYYNNFLCPYSTMHER